MGSCPESEIIINSLVIISLVFSNIHERRVCVGGMDTRCNRMDIRCNRAVIQSKRNRAEHLA